MMGLYYEESEIGQKWRLGSYHFTREAVLRFLYEKHRYSPAIRSAIPRQTITPVLTSKHTA